MEKIAQEIEFLLSEIEIIPLDYQIETQNTKEVD
jgi:hypothetical protein